MSELRKFATRVMFGVITITILKLIYGPTGWNALITFTILTAYYVGRIRPYRKGLGAPCESQNSKKK